MPGRERLGISLLDALLFGKRDKEERDLHAIRSRHHRRDLTVPNSRRRSAGTGLTAPVSVHRTDGAGQRTPVRG